MRSILHFCKKVWFASIAYCSPRTNSILTRLYAVDGFDFDHLLYPTISIYLQSKIKGKNDVDLQQQDYDRLSRLLPSYRYTLDTKAVLVYDSEDDLIPLVLIFNNKKSESGIYVSLLYKNDGTVLGLSIYNPEKNYLAMKYSYQSYPFLINIGIGKVVPGKSEPEWKYNNYFCRNKIVYLDTPPQKRGLVWFTRPFGS